MSYADLCPSSIDKIKSTINYSLQSNPKQNINHVRKRCTIATMAEQQVAYHMSGQVMDSSIDYNDPFSFAFDVLSSHIYHGARIEVKTHQSDARWINVNIDKKNESGFMNLYPLLNYSVADYITVFRSSEIKSGTFSFTNMFTGTPHHLAPLIKKSQYNQYYYLDI